MSTGAPISPRNGPARQSCKKVKNEKRAGVIGEAEDLIVLEAAIQNLLFVVRTVVPTR